MTPTRNTTQPRKDRHISIMMIFILSALAFGLPEVQSESLSFSDGTIESGGKSLTPKANMGRFIVTLDNDVQGHIREQFNFGEGGINTNFFANKKDAFGENSFTYSADAVASIANNKKLLGKYSISMELLESGLIKFEGVYKSTNPSKLKDRYLVIELPGFMTLQGEYVKDDETMSFDSSAEWSGSQLKGAEIKCFPDAEQKSFTIIPEAVSKIRILKSKMVFSADPSGRISFLIDIQTGKIAENEGELSPNGLDFLKIDKLRLPDYGSGKNLVMNPSFEAGFRYWSYRGFADGAEPLKNAVVYDIDRETSHSGGKSLRIQASRSMILLGTSGLPFVPGETYTLSYWAKATRGSGISLQLDSRSGMADIAPTELVPVGNEWQRYSSAFVPKHKFASYYFRATENGGSGEPGFLWIDDIQIERGKMTEFSAPPVVAQLRSKARGNFLEFGMPSDFRIELHVSPGTRGTVSVSVEDFFFRSIFQNKYAFEADNTGRAVVALEALGATVSDRKLRGVFSVDATFTLEGLKRPFSDSFRFSIMNFLENKQKNKDIFCVTYAYSLQAGGPEMERFVERERALGFGSYSYDFIGFAREIDLPLDEERAKLMERYGFESMGRPVLMLHEGLNGEISEGNGTLKMQNIRDRTDPSAEELAEFERICAAKSARRPWNTIWWFTGESNPGIATLESIPDTFAKFLIATNKGIKKGNPNAKVLIEGGPWNMDPELGTKWVERYINDVKRIDPTVKFDGAACHFYGNFPENPDLDHNTSEFIKMLDRNGHENWPVYLNEGGNYLPMNIPQDGFSPYVVNSGNRWLIGPLSYDIGQAERISAAFSARNWLVALKYQDRVKCLNDFITWNRYLDADFTPRAFDKIPNTLGRILGDASFHQDVKFAPYTRCYVFTDDKTGAPIAVIWGHKETVDRWKEAAPIIKFDFGTQDLTFVDLMENEVIFPRDRDGRTLIPMSPFPLFIKAPPGTEDILSSAIANGTFDESSSGLTDGVIDVVAYPNSEGGAAINLKNNLNREIKGEAEMTLNSAVSKIFLEFSALGSQEGSIDLTQDHPGFGKLLEFDFKFKFAGMNSIQLSNPYILVQEGSAAIIEIDGSIADWEGIPGTEIGPGLLVKFFISEDHLHLLIAANDRKMLAGGGLAGVGLYIDPFERISDWTDAKTIKEDLAIFEFQRDPHSQWGAFCHYTQGTVGASGTKYLVSGKIQSKIVVKSGETEDGTFLECRIPQEVLSPLKLVPKSRFGINISVPLKEGGVKTLVPITGFKSPLEAGKITMLMAVICESAIGEANNDGRSQK
jgi:hypothetical protein